MGKSRNCANKKMHQEMRIFSQLNNPITQTLKTAVEMNKKIERFSEPDSFPLRMKLLAVRTLLDHARAFQGEKYNFNSQLTKTSTCTTQHSLPGITQSDLRSMALLFL